MNNHIANTQRSVNSQNKKTRSMAVDDSIFGKKDYTEFCLLQYPFLKSETITFNKRTSGHCSYEIIEDLVSAGVLVYQGRVKGIPVFIRPPEACEGVIRND